MYSAVKYQGKPLYELARAGIEVARKSRLTEIYHLELIDFKPPVVTVDVVCGKGTYIRSLAHDLGQALGCGASLKSLIRLRCGPFDIKGALSLPQLEDAFRYGYWQHLVYPIDTVLLQWTAMVVSDDTSQVIRNGCPVVVANDDRGEQPNRCRVYTPDGCLLGVMRFHSGRGRWQPEKVFL
jgi:tRNA pseudouridine55 synthase